MIRNKEDFKRYVAEDSKFYPKRSFFNLYILQSSKALISQYLYFMRKIEYIKTCNIPLLGGGEKSHCRVLSLPNEKTFMETWFPIP